MRIFVADSGGTYSDAALAAAIRMAKPGDTIIAAAAVNVPAHMPADAPAGMVWKQTCRAERVLHWARRFADWHTPDGVHLCYVRIQARSAAHAALVGAAEHGADLILITRLRGLRGALSTGFGTIRGVLDGAPCTVRVVAADMTPGDMPIAQPRRPHRLDRLEVIARNPAIIRPVSANKPEEQRAT